MKRTLLALTLAAAIAPALAQQYATAKDAEALVAKVARAIAANKDATLKEITAKNPKWVNGDLYPFVASLEGVTLANGQNERMVGKNLIGMRDADGKPMVKVRMELAKTHTKFWQDYKWKDPVTQQVQKKSAYCEKLDQILVCAGIYKR